MNRFLYLAFGLALTLHGCYQSNSSAFYDAMAQAFDQPKTKEEWDAREFYLAHQELSLTYATEICAYFDSGKTDLNFTGTEFGEYMGSSDINASYAATIEAIAVTGLCPSHQRIFLPDS